MTKNISAKNTTDIGHCRECNGQWVVQDGAKGKNYSHVKGRRCPYCSSEAVYYTKEDNR